MFRQVVYVGAAEKDLKFLVEKEAVGSRRAEYGEFFAKIGLPLANRPSVFENLENSQGFKGVEEFHTNDVIGVELSFRNEGEPKTVSRARTLRRECVSAKTRIALGKPGTWMKSRVSWQTRCGCFAMGPLASSIG
jgi:hypothetical protein